MNNKNKIKIPGMLYILVSFMPWIVYWVLCGAGNKLGIIVPLAISLLLIIPQIRKWDLNLMDITSVFYFGIAAITAFIFNLNTFVTNAGFLGYLALFLMAGFSLIIKKPYTLQVSKRDYPEIYWKDKSFLAVNNTITAVWTAIFLANAIIFLLFAIPLTVIASNVLTAFGIVFSIIFPSKAASYLASREFKKYDWDVVVNPQKPKEESEYDVIIVGSGIGGLSCGALLAKRGYKVLVLEQHFQAGGYCSSFKRGGFTFNTGIENVSGLWEKGPVAYLLNNLGLKKEELFARNSTEQFIFKDKKIDIGDLKKTIKQLSDLFPNEKENIVAFFDDAKKAYDECYSDTEIYGTPLPGELIVKVFGRKKLVDYPKEHPHFYDWANKTYKQKLDEYFEDADLKTILCIGLGYHGTVAEKTPGDKALFTRISYYLYGGHYPKGGANISESLKKFIENHNGRVLLKHKADKILIKNKEIEGVKVGDKIFRSPVVVSNANAKTTFLELVEEGNLDEAFLEFIKQLKMSPSAFMVNLGVDMDLSGYPTPILFGDKEGGFAIVINSNADSNMAPEGKSSISLLYISNYYDFPKRGTEEYSKKKKELAEILIQKAEKVIPNLSKYIIVQDAATPKTFERYTSMPEGALYSFDQSVGSERPYFKTPIKGLYLAGASTFPGGGIEAVVISGIICANDIYGWKLS